MKRTKNYQENSGLSIVTVKSGLGNFVVVARLRVTRNILDTQRNSLHAKQLKNLRYGVGQLHN